MNGQTAQILPQNFSMPSDKLFHKSLETYGFNPDDDLLEKLLTLNLELAAKEKNGEAIVGCWAPEQSPSEGQK